MRACKRCGAEGRRADTCPSDVCRAARAGTAGELVARATALDPPGRLLRIRQLLDRITNRAMGTNALEIATRQEMTDQELAEIYVLAGGQTELVDTVTVLAQHALTVAQGPRAGVPKPTAQPQPRAPLKPATGPRDRAEPVFVADVWGRTPRR